MQAVSVRVVTLQVLFAQVLSIKPQYLSIIVPRYEVDWLKTQGEMAHRNLDTEE